MRHLRLAFLVFAIGCSSGTGGPTGNPDLSSGPGSSPDGGVTDAAAPSDSGPPTSDGGVTASYRNSLGVCWTEPSCNRALSVAHGGDWSFTGNPYDSNAAIAAAFANGADGIKLDVRFSSDGVPVIAHSSPIEAFESLDCYNKKIEEMTAAQITQCHRLPSTTETFQRLDEVVAYVRGKLVVQLCVKRPQDLPASVAAVLALDAADLVFLEIEAADVQAQLPSITNSDKVWYLAQINAPTEVDLLLDTVKNPRVFMYEFDPTTDVKTLVADRLHPAGIKSFTYDKNASTTPAIKALFDASFDVVSTNYNGPAVQARIQVNTARGISPP